MLRDMTIGQYYPVESPIHRLDPRTKFLGTIIYVVSLFLFKTFWGFLLAGGFLVMVTILAHIPPKYVLKGMRPMLFLLLFMMIFNLIHSIFSNRLLYMQHYLWDFVWHFWCLGLHS